MIVDTHCHLDFPEFDDDRDEVMARAREAGVAFIVNVGSSVEGSQRSVELARSNDAVYATVGIHPHYAKDVNGKVPDAVKSLVKEEKVVAVGEVGLDYYRNLSPKDVQKSLFVSFLALAEEAALPLVIHARDAHEDLMDILKARLKNKARGVMHCFSGDEAFLKWSLDAGFYISFTCNLTYKNAARLREAAGRVPVDRLLLETDAPFLAPKEFRGKRNEPAHLTYLVDELARIHSLSGDDIERITTHNARELFNLPVEEGVKIAYKIRESLYLNITNRCANECTFCVRNSTDFVKGHNLKLEREPEAREIIEAIDEARNYKEVVFCGYGEPTLRLDVVKEVAARVKEKGIPTRMVTSGAGNLIHKRSIAGELRGLIDRMSVSLNVDTSRKYDEACRSRFGAGTFERIKEFIRECRDAGMEVEATFLELPGVDRAACERIAKNELKVGFRMRRLNVTG